MFLPVLPLGDPTAAEVVGPYVYYFVIYSFLGWVLEGTYNLYSEGTFRKEGFLKGPFKPMYGCAPLLLLAAKELGLPVPALLVLALIIPSAVEYISGWLLATLFHKQWWDYSSMPYQLQGHICLKFSLYWWVLTTACIFLLHPVIEWSYLRVEKLWMPVLPLSALLFLCDLLWTFRVRRRAVKGLELGEG